MKKSDLQPTLILITPLHFSELHNLLYPVYLITHLFDTQCVGKKSYRWLILQKSQALKNMFGVIIDSLASLL